MLGDQAPQWQRPYGLVADIPGNRIWIADKDANTIYSIHSGKNGSASVKSINIQEQADQYFPCMLDFHKEYGLLAGCYGVGIKPGSVLNWEGDKPVFITPMEFYDRVTHCCWLPQGQVCYVTRSDSVLWYKAGFKTKAIPLTLPGNQRVLTPTSGSIDLLRLRYVQGLLYSPSREGLVVADASLGAIFEISIKQKSFRLLAGQPTLSDSTSQANVKAGDPSVWLGRVRGIVEDAKDQLVWLDGDSGKLFRLAENEIVDLGTAVPSGMQGSLLGCGLVRIPIDFMEG